MSRKPPEKPVSSRPLGEGRYPPTPHQHLARQHPRITHFFHPTRPHSQSLNTPALPSQEVAAAVLPNNHPLVSVCNTATTIEQVPTPPLARLVPVTRQPITPLTSHPAPRTSNVPLVPPPLLSPSPSQAERPVPDTGLPHYAHSATYDPLQSQQTHSSYSHNQSARPAPVIGPKTQRHPTPPSFPTSPSHQHSARLVPVIGRPPIPPPTQPARRHTPGTSPSHPPQSSFSIKSARLAPVIGPKNQQPHPLHTGPYLAPRPHLPTLPASNSHQLLARPVPVIGRTAHPEGPHTHRDPSVSPPHLAPPSPTPGLTCLPVGPTAPTPIGLHIAATLANPY